MNTADESFVDSKAALFAEYLALKYKGEIGQNKLETLLERAEHEFGGIVIDSWFLEIADNGIAPIRLEDLVYSDDFKKCLLLDILLRLDIAIQDSTGSHFLTQNKKAYFLALVDAKVIEFKPASEIVVIDEDEA